MFPSLVVGAQEPTSLSQSGLRSFQKKREMIRIIKKNLERFCYVMLLCSDGEGGKKKEVRSDFFWFHGDYISRLSALFPE